MTRRRSSKGRYWKSLSVSRFYFRWKGHTHITSSPTRRESDHYSIAPGIEMAHMIWQPVSARLLLCPNVHSVGVMRKGIWCSQQIQSCAVPASRSTHNRLSICHTNERLNARLGMKNCNDISSRVPPLRCSGHTSGQNWDIITDRNQQAQERCFFI